MTTQYSTIQLSRNKSYDYIHPIVYKQVSALLYKEEFGVSQSCKYNHLQDYYYLIELLTQVKKKVDFIINNDCCYTYAQIKSIYTKYGLDCAIKCFACHNLPYKELLKNFDINTEFVKELDNKYLLQYEVQIWDEDLITSTISNILIEKNSNYTLNIVNPDVLLYDYMSLQKDDEYIIPTTNTIVFIDVECNHKVVAKFRLIGCAVAAPTQLTLTPSAVTQTGLTVTWGSAGSNIQYLVELIENAIVIQSATQTLLSKTFTGLLPSSDYAVRVTAVNCAGTTNSTLKVQTAPYLIVVEVINGTSPQSGNSTVVYGSSFLTNFTSTNPKTITSFTVNNIAIPFNQLTISGTLLGQPQTGTYNLTAITTDKYIKIIYADYDVCLQVNMTYTALTNTITIQ